MKWHAIIGKYLLQAIYWVAKSFLGANGEPSSRRLLIFSIFVTCYAVGRARFTFTIADGWMQLYALILDAAFMCTLYGIMNPADLAWIKGGLTPQHKKDPPKDEKQDV